MFRGSHGMQLAHANRCASFPIGREVSAVLDIPGVDEQALMSGVCG